jgi:hypothetical protein
MLPRPLSSLFPHLLREHQFYLHRTVIEYLGGNLRGRERNTENHTGQPLALPVTLEVFRLLVTELPLSLKLNII